MTSTTTLMTKSTDSKDDSSFLLGYLGVIGVIIFSIVLGILIYFQTPHGRKFRRRHQLWVKKPTKWHPKMAWPDNPSISSESSASVIQANSTSSISSRREMDTKDSLTTSLIKIHNKKVAESVSESQLELMKPKDGGMSKALSIKGSPKMKVGNQLTVKKAPQVVKPSEKLPISPKKK